MSNLTLSTFPGKPLTQNMTRLVGRRRKEVLGLYSWLQQTYDIGNEFTASLAHRRAVAGSVLPYGKWSVARFTESIELLVSHRLMEVKCVSNESSVYWIPKTLAKRRKAKNSLPEAFEAMKAGASGEAVPIRQIEVHGGRPQLVRTAIDVMAALGNVRVITTRSESLVKWDCEQERALQMIESTTKEYFQVKSEIEALEKEEEQLKNQLLLTAVKSDLRNRFRV
jgi:hypothetical protein